tara:strand:+ start:3233 stop:4444 length:1212 start_codon:yes stop_codon:yes gene_type:complete
LADKFQYVYTDPTPDRTACITGSVPYGTHNSDTEFCNDSVNVCKWVAKRLGHPVMQLEFNSGSIYAMFEESVSEYSSFINNYNAKNWFWESYGSESTGSSFASASTDTTSVVHPRMGLSTTLSEQYGQAINVGGSVTLHSASITLTSSQQQYDLQSAFSASVATSTELSESTNKRITVHNVYNEGPAAITRFYDPYVGSYDQRNMLDSFGFGSYAPATTFLLRPISFDVTRAQQIETSDKIRKSNYSFEITNNRIKIFPEPTADDDGGKVWFEYTIKDDESSDRSFTDGKVSDPSNIPYKFIPYSSINSVGRQWIRKYSLALSKELLGIIRSKYGSMPLPNGEVNLDGEALKAEGREEKNQLIEELKEFLDSVQLSEKARLEAEQADAQQTILNKSPLGIYIG